MKDMAKIIHGLSYRHDKYRVFSDFVEMSALAISNAVDRGQFEKREKRYLDVVKGYTKDELNEFPKLLAMLTTHLEEKPGDVLGALYNELEIHNERAGQYFTPDEICRLMARLTFGENVKDVIGDKGYVTASEPACGSGAMVIACANEMREQGINYQTTLHVTAVDVDIRCVHIAYVQFSLLHIPAVVVHGNSLTLEEFSQWYTPAHVLGRWGHRLNNRGDAFTETAREAIAQVQALTPDVLPPDVDVQSAPQANDNRPKAEKGMQLRMFG